MSNEKPELIEGLFYSSVEGGYAVVGFEDRTRRELVVPESANGKPVKGIYLANLHRWDRDRIEKVTIPNSVDQIGQGSFYRFRMLREVTFAPGAQVWVISIGAFRECGIEAFTVPKTVEQISDCAFAGCWALKSVVFEQGSCLKQIGSFAFQGTVITSITIPKSVKKIDRYCFQACQSLVSVVFEVGSALERLDEGAFAFSGIKTIALPSQVKEIGNACFQGCTSLTSVVVEGGSNLKRIGISAFFQSGITTFAVPKKVTVISPNCFLECQSLTSVTFELPAALRCISEAAFQRSGLKNINIPKNVTEIGDYCFAGCGNLSEVAVAPGSDLIKIGNGAFTQSAIRRFVCPKSVEELGPNCFSECTSLTEIKFEGSFLRKLGSHAFEKSGIKSLDIPNGITEIPKKCFEKCASLSSVSLANSFGIRSIGDSAFAQSGITSLYFPRSVLSIGKRCFQKCASLTEVTFESGSSLSNIGSGAFEKSAIKSIVNGETLRGVLFAGDTGLTAAQLHISPALRETEAPTSLSRSLSKCDWIVDIPDYKYIRHIGTGGFSSVDLYEKKDGTPVAIKFTRDSTEIDQKVFEIEFGTLVELSHHCIVNIVGCSLPSPKNDHKFAIVMEYMEGGSLKDVIANKPGWFDDTAKAIIVYGIARGMHYVHSHDIIHRDLKPGNVLLDERHRPRICDFGSSRIASTDVTLTQNPACTPLYAAPEFVGSDYDNKVDVYSFAMILWEIITGKRAFSGIQTNAIMGRVACGAREKIPNDASQFTSNLISASWSGNPSDRPSFSEICELLETDTNIASMFPRVDLAKFQEYIDWVNR